MATVGDLQRRLGVIIDDDVDNADSVDWFNQCNDTLSSVLYMPKLTTITKVDGYFTVPSDYNGELKILDPANIDEFSVYDGKIYFDDSASVSSIQITYNRLPAEITNTLTQVPDIPKQFHDLYVYYAAMQAMHIEEEPERYALYQTEYNRLFAQLQNYMGKTRPKPANWTVVR